MGRKISFIIPALLLFLILIGIVGGGGFYLRMNYMQTKDKLVRELQELPSFDSVEAGKDIAKEMGIPYPVKKPVRTVDDIDKEVKRLAKEKTHERFPAKETTAKRMKIMRKYRKANVGDEITFQDKISGDVIKGIYKGKETRPSAGTFVTVKTGLLENKYSMRKIMPEYYYLFNQGDSDVIIKAKLKEFKDDLNAKKKAFYDDQFDAYEKKLYPPAGYEKVSGKWVHRYTEFEEKLTQAEKTFEKDVEKQKADLRMKYRFLGMFDIKLDNDVAIEKSDKVDDGKKE